jgi:hypothetical protein
MQVLFASLKMIHGIATGTNEISHRFMSGVRHPNRVEFSRSVETGQLEGIAAICLYALARLARNPARRHHRAKVASGYNLALKAIATTTSFVAKMEFLFGFCQPLSHDSPHFYTAP